MDIPLKVSSGASKIPPYRALIVILFLSLALLTSACLVEDEGVPLPTGPSAPTATSQPGYTVYFTDPNDPSAPSNRDGPDEYLVAAVQGAKVTIDVAVYDFSLWELRDALISSHNRGLQVRMVTESDNLDEPEVEELRQAGIQVIGDRREGLMHNKFLVIDRQEVWTGSANYNIASFYQNDNNLIRIRSSRLAEDYTTEFEEMFLDDQFGPGSPANTPYPALTLDGVNLEVYFSPDDGTLARLLELVSAAQESIYFLAYSFTSDALAEAITARGQQGVDVKGVFEKDQYESNTGTEFDNLLAAGFDMHLDANPRHMHHKVIIIDQQIVVTGSYNFSANAEKRNDENLLIIFDPEIAAQYLVEFWRVINLTE
jgi:phosphatidylserine/phosphatidylglycerophosphate/cardiolipin synthase-like enzyme